MLEPASIGIGEDPGAAQWGTPGCCFQATKSGRRASHCDLRTEAWRLRSASWTDRVEHFQSRGLLRAVRMHPVHILERDETQLVIYRLRRYFPRPNWKAGKAFSTRCRSGS